MNKFNEIYNRILFEELNSLPTTSTVLPVELCNPANCYKWVKGQANVYGCLITAENLPAVTNFLQVRENASLKPQVGRYLVYNPNIAEEDGQIWMNKLNSYVKATPENSAFESTHLSQNGLEFDEYVFLPKTDESEMTEGDDWWYGFQIPQGMQFTIESGCGNNGADGSTAYSTDWLPIVNGKFDWSRSRGSMKQSNFICDGKGIVELTPEAQENWNNSNK